MVAEIATFWRKKMNISKIVLLGLLASFFVCAMEIPSLHTKHKIIREQQGSTMRYATLYWVSYDEQTGVYDGEIPPRIDMNPCGKTAVLGEQKKPRRVTQALLKAYYFHLQKHYHEQDK